MRRRQREDQIRAYTTPKIRYNYRKLSWDDYISNRYNGYRTERSSIIPVTRIGEEIHWLLGSFWDFPKEILSDFGGNCRTWEPPAKKGQPRPRDQERNRQAPLSCSTIELWEESKGLLVKPVLKALGSLPNNDIYIYEGLDGRKKERVIFMLLFINYDEISNIPYEFETIKDNRFERLGPLDFYKEEDLLRGKYLTSRNLTDFINFLKR